MITHANNSVESHANANIVFSVDNSRAKIIHNRFEYCDWPIELNKTVITGKDRLYSASCAGERNDEKEKETSAFHINHSSFISLIHT